MRLVLLLFATFWFWQTIRFAAERFVPTIFDLTRPAHPLVALVLPLFVLWPDWVAALGVCGAVVFLVGAADRWFGFAPTAVVQFRGRRKGALPRLP